MSPLFYKCAFVSFKTMNLLRAKHLFQFLSSCRTARKTAPLADLPFWISQCQRVPGGDPWPYSVIIFLLVSHSSLWLMPPHVYLQPRFLIFQYPTACLSPPLGSQRQSQALHAPNCTPHLPTSPLGLPHHS